MKPSTRAKSQGKHLLSRRHTLMLLGASVVSCRHLAPVPAGHAMLTPSQPPLVVLIAIDGVRWQDVFHGPDQARTLRPRAEEQWLPHLSTIEQTGAVLGAPGCAGFYASGPNFVSLPGYMEMLAGSTSLDCTENDCASMKAATLLDDFEQHAPVDASPSAVFSSWPKVETAAGREQVGVVSAGRFSGFNEELLMNYPDSAAALHRSRSHQSPAEHFRSDKETAEIALKYLEEAAPPFLFVSLGEPDEEAHRDNYEGYLRSLREADAFVGKVRAALTRFQERGRRTLLFVTTDHGRANNFVDHGRKHPESSRAFLFAEGAAVRARGRISVQKRHLKDIAPTVRALSGLPPGEGPGSGRIIEELLS